MRRIIAMMLALIMILSLTACVSKQPAISVADKLNKIPTQPQEPETPAEPEEQPEPDQSDKDKGGKDKGGKDKNDKNEMPDPEPSQGLDAYANPCDHPHEGTDLTVYDGLYRAQTPQGDDGETWLQIKGYNDFIMLEYHGLQEGEIYRYWAEEFWPGEGWYTSTETNTVSGKSQVFSSMAQYENYSGLPRGCTISLTKKGVELSYADGSAAAFVRDDSFFGGHNSAEDLRLWFGDETHLDFEYQYDSADVLGAWGFWDGWQAGYVSFAEDGTFSLFWKVPNEPIRVYQGAYGFGVNSGNLEILAERIGYGMFPAEANWEWFVDEWGYLNLFSEVNEILEEGQYYFWPVEESFFTVLNADNALGYITSNFTERGDYIDRYDSEYSYYYSLPQFYHSEYDDLNEINEAIWDFYYPIVETELRAIDEGEFLTYDHVDWQSAAYNGILFLHVYAYTYDWEEHAAFYIDLETMEQIDAEEMLKRLGLDETFFLESIRTYAEESFVEHFSAIPEKDREMYGYYECLEQTVSDDFVNLEIPIFVDTNGNICVQVMVSSMAGSGIMWVSPAWFLKEGNTYTAPGVYVDEAVG